MALLTRFGRGRADFAVTHKSYSAGRTPFTGGLEAVIVEPTHFKQFVVETQNMAVRPTVLFQPEAASPRSTFR
jgi:hypothetical protein